MNMTVFWDAAPCNLVDIDVSELYTASIIRTITLMIEAIKTSETYDNFYETISRNITEDSHLRARRRENLKFHYLYFDLDQTGMVSPVCIHFCWNLVKHVVSNTTLTRNTASSGPQMMAATWMEDQNAFVRTPFYLHGFRKGR
jgi:hypothetical protein